MENVWANKGSESAVLKGTEQRKIYLSPPAGYSCYLERQTTPEETSWWELFQKIWAIPLGTGWYRTPCWEIMLLSVCGDEMTEVHVLTKNFFWGKKNKKNSAVIDNSKCAVFGFPSGPLLGVSLNNFNLGGISEARSPPACSTAAEAFFLFFFLIWLSHQCNTSLAQKQVDDNNTKEALCTMWVQWGTSAQ